MSTTTTAKQQPPALPPQLKIPGEGAPLRHRRLTNEYLAEIKSLFDSRPSLLSSESSANSYRGFLNLTIILLVLSNIRLVVENLMKYGILFLDLTLDIEWSRWPGVQIGLSLVIYIVVAWLLELGVARGTLNERAVFLLQCLNITALIFVPSALVWTMQPNPGSGILLMSMTSVLAMKLTSYAVVNYQVRSARKKKTPDDKSYPVSPLGTHVEAEQWPDNLTAANMVFFMCVPTMVYQLKYPRTSRIRKGFLLRRIFEAIVLSILMVAVVIQYILPLVHNSLNPLNTQNFTAIAERLLKLCVPNLYVWLLGFYVLFHLYLNIMAELCRYADRMFYRDWWNATTLAYFWRAWNRPVHDFMAVHVYSPALRAGMSQLQANFICFFLSAIFHELIIAVPFRMVKLWSFGGMMLQIPLIFLSQPLKGKQLGNVIFWFSIVLGQPFLTLMIYRDWYQRNYAL